MRTVHADDPAQLPPATTRFSLGPDSDAAAPPERRGLARDGVRLLIAEPHALQHRLFRDLPEVLSPGDLLVVNTSATVPAALRATHRRGGRARLHVSTELDDGSWVVEPRLPANDGPDLRLRAGDSVRLAAGVGLRLLDSYPRPGATAGSRLWRASVSPATDLLAFLGRHGRPIEYDYLHGSFDLADHQNVYASQPGSAEMPSAGRPFTAPLLVRLMARGITIAPVLLHCGVSSQEAHEAPLPERFEVGPDTARLVRSAWSAGRRVVAVGTTVVRALESAAGADGRVRAASGWTELVVGPGYSPRAVTGLLTGLHAPQASHLLMLEALAGPQLVERAYDSAVRGHYLWHEFGDSMLFLL
ncbi:S-adenosylmethionine:tRNA ribosyltransferase-isomerase [Angustibacter sp. McL0619]|uniref:S-adenosylmethionine:tRNA ribosyltransferase-isomerase n=1 Tax=Angustibacter sp. McL0619 TaxID=3415676 RepID=UPI003CF75CBF